jgi:hypothetical protein
MRPMSALQAKFLSLSLSDCLPFAGGTASPSWSTPAGPCLVFWVSWCRRLSSQTSSGGCRDLEFHQVQRMQCTSAPGATAATHVLWSPSGFVVPWDRHYGDAEQRQVLVIPY